MTGGCAHEPMSRAWCRSLVDVVQARRCLGLSWTGRCRRRTPSGSSARSARNRSRAELTVADSGRAGTTRRPSTRPARAMARRPAGSPRRGSPARRHNLGAEDLLRCGCGQLSRRELHDWPARVLDQLVRRVQVRRIRRGTYLGPDREQVDRRIRGYEVIDAILVQPATNHNAAAVRPAASRVRRAYDASSRRSPLSRRTPNPRSFSSSRSTPAAIRTPRSVS